MQCTRTEFKCQTSANTCVEYAKVCDGNNDCLDGSDENFCQNTSCDTKNNEYICNDLSCIEISLRCDGRPDFFVPPNSVGQYSEYRFTANNLDSFVGYSIKIILSGTNQAYYPRIKDLRTIALA